MKKMPLAEAATLGRICWNCAHINFDEGAPNYSEVTPGYDMTLECAKQYWRVSARYDEDDTRSPFEKLRSAEQCADYVELRRP